MDLYLLKFLQDPEVSYYPMLHLMEAALALLVVTLALSLIQRELLSRLIVKAFRDITGVHNKTSLEKLVQDLSNRPSTFGVGVMMFDLNNLSMTLTDMKKAMNLSRPSPTVSPGSWILTVFWPAMAEMSSS